MTQTNALCVHHQNVMLAVRREMGWPAFRPANDGLCFAFGRIVDAAIGSKLAAISEQMRRDIVYAGWTSVHTRRPAQFTIVCREMLTIDVVTDVVPWCASQDEPIVFVSARNEQFFAIDSRGSLVRLPGRPAHLAMGRRLAMRRIVTTAAKMGGEVLASNRLVPRDGRWIEPEVPVETVIRFR